MKTFKEFISEKTILKKVMNIKGKVPKETMAFFNSNYEKYLKTGSGTFNSEERKKYNDDVYDNGFWIRTGSGIYSLERMTDDQINKRKNQKPDGI